LDECLIKKIVKEVICEAFDCCKHHKEEKKEEKKFESKSETKSDEKKSNDFSFDEVESFGEDKSVTDFTDY